MSKTSPYYINIPPASNQGLQWHVQSSVPKANLLPAGILLTGVNGTSFLSCPEQPEATIVFVLCLVYLGLMPDFCRLGKE